MDEEMEQEGRGLALGILAGVAIGALIGAAVGLIYAPKAGKETRDEVSKALSDATRKLKEYGEEVKTKITEAVEAAKDTYLKRKGEAAGEAEEA
jgi:gas vesicle protein